MGAPVVGELRKNGYGDLAVRDLDPGEGPRVFTISARDCRTGKVKSYTDCAAAKGAKRTLGARDVFVHATRAYIVYQNEVVRCSLGKEAQQALRDFDEGKIAMGRMEMRFDPIPPSQRIGATPGRTSRTGNRNGRARPRRLATR